ncbi:MAG: HAD family acid phosphatase [Legionella sp.]|nr:HAD family acid phosphatase [Legionella sp.]
MDKRIRLHAFFMVTALLCVGTKSFAEPQNIGALRTELQAYHDTGAYDKEVAAVIKKAETYIDARETTNSKLEKPEKLALVLDIDDTSLSNYKHIIERDFCQNKHLIKSGILRADAPAIAPTLALYKNARKEKIAVFFVTGRRPDLQKATERNLKAAGYTTWSGIFFRPKEDTNQSIVPYKTQVRSNITQQGYTIIATIGDQDSDLAGGYAEKTFKLPNPFYYLR